MSTAANTKVFAGSFRRVFRKTSENGILTPDAIWQEFLYALRDFSFGDSLFKDDHENTPHILAAERVKSSHFRGNLSGFSGQLLECVFEEGQKHCASGAFAAATGAVAHAHRRLGFWREMYDIVAKKLAGFDGERAEAFHVLIDTCRAWQLVTHGDRVGSVRLRGQSADTWRQALNGLMIRLPRAMEVLWKAYPCADPLVEEGVQICFDDTAGLAETLTGGRALRRGSHADAALDEVMNDAALDLRQAAHTLQELSSARPYDRETTRARAQSLRETVRLLRRAIALRSVAAQYLANLETLRPLAGRIAYRTATIFESRPRHMQENWVNYYEPGTLGDSAKAEILFAHCRDLRSGMWFESRRAQIQQSLNALNREVFLCTRAHGDVIVVNADGSVCAVGHGADSWGASGHEDGDLLAF